MVFDDIVSVLNATPTNKFIVQNLDSDTVEYIIEVLEKLEAKDFKEINTNAEFELNDLPIPYSTNVVKERVDEYSQNVRDKLDGLFSKINKQGTNVEYPCVLWGKECYNNFEQFGAGGSQTCVFDWEWIENFVKNCESGTKLSLLHTHPNPIGVVQKTLYNKYTSELVAFGVKANGLNISLADVYACQYLHNLANKYNKDITVESAILMFNGDLVTFDVASGLAVKNVSNINMMKSVSHLGERGEQSASIENTISK